MPKNPTLKKVLLIGSGPIQIGQAAEFDYAGSQACKAVVRRESRVVSATSNPPTSKQIQEIQTKAIVSR